MNLARFIPLLPLFLFASCTIDKEDDEVAGMKPLYVSYNELLDFAQLQPQPVVNAGKIMVYQQYLFLGEINKGIHIIDISDTLNPVKISYLKIAGAKDFSAQNNRLYTDNGPHLLVLNIENILQVNVVKRKLNNFQPSEYYPENYSGPFECADYSKGWLTGWINTTLVNPKCRRL